MHPWSAIQPFNIINWTKSNLLINNIEQPTNNWLLYSSMLYSSVCLMQNVRWSSFTLLHWYTTDHKLPTNTEWWSILLSDTLCAKVYIHFWMSDSCFLYSSASCSFCFSWSLNCSACFCTCSSCFRSSSLPSPAIMMVSSSRCFLAAGSPLPSSVTLIICAL